METLKFGIRNSYNGTRNFIAISVPPRVQDGLEYHYSKLLKDIGKGTNASIKTRTEADNKVFVIDHRVIGRSTSLQRSHALRRTMDLVHATQFIAQKNKLLDPSIQMLPSMSAQQGVYPLAAKLMISPDLKASPESYRMGALAMMMEIHRDLLDPSGDEKLTERRVAAQLDLRRGAKFLIGQTGFEAPITDVMQPQLVFAGKPDSHEEALVFMGGAIMLAQPAQN